MLKNPLNSLYKETGASGCTPKAVSLHAKQPASLEAKARRVSNRSKVAAVWGKVYLIPTVDMDVPHLAFRIYALIAECSWRGDYVASYEELAEIFDSCVRVIKYHIKILEDHGYIAVERVHNRRNMYTPKVVTAAPEPKPIIECPQCHCYVKQLGKTGWCRPCAKLAKDKVAYAAASKILGPAATHSEIAAYLQDDKVERQWLRAKRALEREGKVA